MYHLPFAGLLFFQINQMPKHNETKLWKLNRCMYLYKHWTAEISNK